MVGAGLVRSDPVELGEGHGKEERDPLAEGCSSQVWALPLIPGRGCRPEEVKHSTRRDSSSGGWKPSSHCSPVEREEEPTGTPAGKQDCARRGSEGSRAPALPTWARPPLPPSPGLCHAVLPIVDRPSTWGHTRPPLPSCPLPQGCPFTRPRQSAQRSSLAGPQSHAHPQPRAGSGRGWETELAPEARRPVLTMPAKAHTAQLLPALPPHSAELSGPAPKPAPLPSALEPLRFLPLNPPVAHPAKPSRTQSNPTRKKITAGISNGGI